ncbi:uncharacterized protein LOC132305049 [Cornus florida]|uniref:uncharacterized protein LOC132305049 n=1 Tax=Cornus florida TaxID=4283 RepID=UPI0028A14680|nr:uncharacterized protein LOC132305049 [Cornus florida]
MEEQAAKNSSVMLLLHNAHIITMDPQNRVFRHGGIVIVNDKIKAIGDSGYILRQFSPTADEIIDLKDRILLPGLIDTHVHTSQQLAREILVTCFAEAGGQHVSEVAKAVELLGLRACLTRSIMDSGEGLPTSWTNWTTHDCIQSQKLLYKKHHNTVDGRIRIWLGIRQIMNSTERLLLESRDTAEELKTGIHMNVAETYYEIQVVRDTLKVDHGCGTVAYLEKIKLLQSNLLAAHTIYVSDTEIDFLARAGVKVSYCLAAEEDDEPTPRHAPIAMEFAVGEMVYSIQNEIREVYDDRTACPFLDVLKMATVNGAKSVLWDNEIGSLEVGKKADMIVVHPFSSSMVTLQGRNRALLHSLGNKNIISVMCNGRWIMKDHKILNVDEEEIISMGKHASSKLFKRAGIVIPDGTV